MILIKNQANQFVYSKLVDVLTGTPAAGVSGSLLTANISKDGGTEAVVANSISEVGHGIYKLQLTQAETNTNTGVIHFRHTTNTQYQFETLYFQTSDATPNVVVTTNNDKTGYSLSSSQTFSTSGSVGSIADVSNIQNSIKSATYDGISQDRLYAMLIAFIAGKVVVTTVDSTTRNLSYKKRDGTTEELSINVSTVDGARGSGGTIAS